MYTINRRLPVRGIAIPDGYAFNQLTMLPRGMGDAWSTQQTLAWMLLGGALMAAGVLSIWKVA
jgi:hypothetical protein